MWATAQVRKSGKPKADGARCYVHSTNGSVDRIQIHTTDFIEADLAKGVDVKFADGGTATIAKVTVGAGDEVTAELRKYKDGKPSKRTGQRRSRGNDEAMPADTVSDSES